MQELVTMKDIMQIYKISRSTIDRWRSEGMPCSKVGRSIRFNLEEVKKWIENNKQS